MIKELSSQDADIIHDIINQAACAYKGIIPEDCYHEPYMPQEELHREMKSMTFFGWQEEGKLIGVISIGDMLKAKLEHCEFQARHLEDYITGKYPG